MFLLLLKFRRILTNHFPKHDAQLDYYGKRLATCSSDRTVKVFDVIDGETQRTPGHTLKGCVEVSPMHQRFLMFSLYRHTGPVWQVAWAHPKYGHILASCSYDGKVLIWKEQQGQGNVSGSWIKIKEHTLHTASGLSLDLSERFLIICITFSVNSVSWAPHELGAILACASSDGKVSVLTFKSMSSTITRVSLSNPLYKMMVNGTPTSSLVMPLAAMPFLGHLHSFLGLLSHSNKPQPQVKLPHIVPPLNVSQVRVVTTSLKSGDTKKKHSPGLRKRFWKAIPIGYAMLLGHRTLGCHGPTLPRPLRIRQC